MKANRSENFIPPFHATKQNQKQERAGFISFSLTAFFLCLSLLLCLSVKEDLAKKALKFETQKNSVIRLAKN